MAEKIAKTGIKREPGFLYFVDKQGDAAKAPMAQAGKRPSGGAIKVAKTSIRKEPGYLYFIDKQGDIARVLEKDVEKEAEGFEKAHLVDEDGKIIGRCPSCNTVARRSPTALFCPNCGYKLKKEKEELKCYNCGEPIHESDKYCEICGATLNVSAEAKGNLLNLNPFEFEKLISELFEKMGYQTELTSKTGDYGVDVIARDDNNIIAIQCKKYSDNTKVSNVDVQKLLGAMMKVKAKKSILITTSDFTNQAKEQAKGAPIELWTKKQLLPLIEKYLSN